MKISPEILDALQKAVSRFPNRNQFAIKVGVPQHTLVRWLDGISKSISDTNYEKLFPLIKPYLKNDYRLPWEPGEYIPKRISKKDFIERIIESGHGDKIERARSIDCFRRSLQNAVMNLDISDDAKVKVYHLIGNHIPKPEEYQ